MTIPKEKEDPCYRKKLNNLIDATMMKLPSVGTSNTLRSDLRNHIEQRYSKIFTDLHTPDHPTYALMIRTAIEELNEEEGSTEEAISKFIKEEFEDLPWCHASMLSLHLKKLTKSGEIVSASENCYMLPVKTTNSRAKREKGKKQKMRHKKGRRGDRQHKFEKGQQSEEEQMVKDDMRSGKLAIEVNGELNGEHKHQIEEIDQNRSHKLQTELIGEQRQEEHQIEVTAEQQSPAEEQRFEVDDKENQALGQQCEETEEDKTAEERQIEVNEEQSQQDGEHGQPIQEVVDHNLSGQQIKVIEEQKPPEWRTEHEQQVVHGQLSETTVDQNLSVTEEQKPAEQQIEQYPEVKGYEVQKLAAEQVEVLEEQIEQLQQLEVIGKHSEAKQQKTEVNEEQNQEEKGEVIEDQYPSQGQQNRLQEEVSAPQGQTRRQEIEVVVEEQNGAELNNKMTGEQIQEERVDDVIQEQCQKKDQQSEVIEEQNLPQDHQIEDAREQIQVIEKLIEQQRKKIIEDQNNEVIVEQNNPPTEVGSKIIGLSDVQELLSRKEEKDEAVVTTLSSSLTIQELDNDRSLLPSKDKCIELLKRTKKIEEQLMDIFKSYGTREVSKHDTLKTVMEKQEKELLKEQKLQTKSCCRERECIVVCGFPTQKQHQLEICGQQNTSVDFLQQSELKQQIELSDLKRPPEHELDKLELFQKHKKQVKVCGQQEVPKCQPESSGHSPDALTSTEQLEDEQRQEFGDSKRGLELESISIEAENGGKEASILKTSLNMDSRQLEKEKQLGLPEGHPELCRQLKPSECLPVMSSLDVSLDSQELELEQQPEPPQSEKPQQIKSSIRVEPPNQKQQLQAALSGEAKAHCQLKQEWQPENLIQEQPLELELTTLEQSYQMQPPTKGQWQQRQPRPQARRSFKFDCVESRVPEHQLEQEQLLKSQIQERYIEIELATLKQSCQSQQQAEGQQQRCQLQPPKRLSESICEKAKTRKSQLEQEQKLQIPIQERPLELELTTLKKSCQMQQLNQGQLHSMQLQPWCQMLTESDSGKAKAPEAQLVQEQQLENPIQGRPIELELTILEKESCQKQQPTQGQHQQRQLQPQGQRPSKSDSGDIRAPECQDQQPERTTQESSMELELTTVQKSGQTVQLLEQEWPTENPVQERTIELQLETLEQSGQTHLLSQEQPQRGQPLRRSLRLYNSEPPTTTSMVELSLQQHEQQQENQNTERLQEQKTTLEHQPLRRSLRLYNSEPPITTSIVELSLQQHEQQPENQNTERLQELKTTLEHSCQTPEKIEGQQQQRQLRPRGHQGTSQPELAVDNTKTESLPSRHPHEQQQKFKRDGRGRPRKLKPDVDMTIGELARSDVHKKKPDTLRCEHDLDDQNHNELEKQQQPKKRGRGRPRKSQCQGQEMHHKSKTKPDAVLQMSIPSDNQNHSELEQQQQPKKPGRGRPRKPKPATSMESLLTSQQQEQPQKPRLRRPPKRKLDADITIGDPLTSQNKKQQPKRRCRERPLEVN